MPMRSPSAVSWPRDASALPRPRRRPPGHRDFYPSPERPIGWRGDGTGAYPGATPVRRVHGRHARAGRRFVRWDRPGPQGSGSSPTAVPNIVWKTRMPGFAESQPIVVGDRVITTADPYSLVCVDAHTGEILWVRESNPLEIMGCPRKRSARQRCTWSQVFALVATFRSLVGNYTRLPGSHGANIAKWKKHMLWAEQVLLSMNRGPFAEHVQEALRHMDALLIELEAMTPGDNSAA